MDITGTREHLHAGTLSALLAREARRQPPVTKTDVSRDLDLTPANLRAYETGERPGWTAELRGRVAAWAGVDVEQVTCWCDMPVRQVRGRDVAICRSAIR